MTNILHPAYLTDGIPDYPYREYKAPALQNIKKGDHVKLVPQRLTFPMKQAKTLPYGAVFGAELNKSGSRLLVGTDYTPFLWVYDWNTDMYKSIDSPVDVPPKTGVHTVSGDAELSRFACGLHASPYALVFERKSNGKYSRGLGFDILPDDDIGSSDMSEDGNMLVLGGHLNSNVYLYVWDDSIRMYLKLKNPDVSPIAEIESVHLTKNGTRLFIGTRDKKLYIYDFNVSARQFQLISPPDVSPKGRILCIDTAPDGSRLVIGTDEAPFLFDYLWNVTYYSHVGAPDKPPVTGVRSISISESGADVACGLFTIPFIDVYNRNGASLVKQAIPTGLPTQGVRSVNLVGSGERLVVGAYSPEFLLTYYNYNFAIVPYDGAGLDPQRFAYGVALENLIAGNEGMAGLYFSNGV